MKSTKSKLNYAIDFISTTFIEDELSKLKNYAQSIKSFRFTSRICFLFLVCKAKTSEKELNTTERQNIHNVSIVVRVIIMLYQKAFEFISNRVR